jgi:hypothetical protein
VVNKSGEVLGDCYLVDYEDLEDEEDEDDEEEDVVVIEIENQKVYEFDASAR